jgi:hypothetical protein
MPDHRVGGLGAQDLLNRLVQDLADPELQQGLIVWIVPSDARARQNCTTITLAQL